nr:DUF2274 domain-containing protein [Sphingomonas sp.]
MAELKLPQLPDRIPVKISISLMPDLHQALTDYAALYSNTYGCDEPIAELIPAILTAFLQSDRTFTRGRTGKAREG